MLVGTGPAAGRPAATTGRIAIVSQPRHPGATRDPSLAAREKAGLLRAAGFTPTRTECLDLDPPAVCVIAVAGPPLRRGRTADRASPVPEHPGNEMSAAG